MGLIKSQTIQVITPKATLDELGEPVAYSEDVSTVENVVVRAGATSDLDTTRPNGVKVAYTLCFPKTYTESLKDCKVKLFDEVYNVIGDPKAYMEENTPTEWNLTCEVEAVNG